MADDLKRVVAWKSLLINGTDYCALWQSAEGWLLKGTVVGVLKDQRPMLANYEIHCDDNWLTRRVQVECTIGKDTKPLGLSVESHGVWRSSGQELPELHGCPDVDLAVTPATNTAHHGVTRFSRQGAVRDLYLTLLGSHTILAVAIVPLVLTTLYRAWRGRFERHRRIARWTFPLWFYVSVTGVVVYWMLYHLYPPVAVR